MGCGASHDVHSRENRYLPEYLDGFEVEPIRWSGKAGGEVVKDLFGNSSRLGDAEIIKVARITSNLMGVSGLRDLLPCKFTHNALCAMARQCGTSDAAMWLAMMACQLQRHPHGTTLFRSFRMEAAVRSLIEFSDTPESVKWVCNALSCCCDVATSANQVEVESMLSMAQFATTDESIIALAKRMLDVAELFSPKLSHLQRVQFMAILRRCHSPESIQTACCMFVNLLRLDSVCESFSTMEMRTAVLQLAPEAAPASSAIAALLCLISRLMRGSSLGCRLFASEPVVRVLCLLSSGVGDSVSSEWWCRVAVLVWESLPTAGRTRSLPESSLGVAPFCSSNEAVCAFCAFVSATQPHSPSSSEVFCERILDIGTYASCDDGALWVSRALCCTSHGAWNVRVSLVLACLSRSARSTQAITSVAKALRSFSFAGQCSFDELQSFCNTAVSLLHSSNSSDEGLGQVAVGVEQFVSTCTPTTVQRGLLFNQLLEGLVSSCQVVSTSSTLRAWCQSVSILIGFAGCALEVGVVKSIQFAIAHMLSLSVSLREVSVLPLLEALGTSVFGSDGPLVNERLRNVVVQLMPLLAFDNDVVTLGRALNRLTSEYPRTFTSYEVMLSVLAMGAVCKSSLSVMWVSKTLINLTFDHQIVDDMVGNKATVIASAAVRMCSSCADLDVDSISAESLCQALAQLCTNYDVRRVISRNLNFFEFLVYLPSPAFSSDFVRWYCALIIAVASLWKRDGLPSEFQVRLLCDQVLNLASQSRSTLSADASNSAWNILRQL